MLIGSNGLISFDLGPAGGYCQWPINDPIPSLNNPLNSIMGCWHDIDPGVSGNVRWATYGTAPCRVFVVSFDQIPMFDCNNIINTQQIVLYETTNVIETYIENKPTCTSWNGGAAIHGLHNATGTQAVVVPGRNFPTNWTAQNDAWAFVPSGAQNYTISWTESGSANPIATTDTVTVCPAGTQEYICEVTYTNCNGSTVVVDDTVTVTAGSGNFNVGATGTDPLCAGASDGTATATVSGSTPPVTYAWNTSPAQNTASLSGLAAGTYSVTVTDASGCSVSQQVVLNDPPGMTLTTIATDVLCNGDADGTATVNVTGGQAPYTYDWNFGPGAALETGLAGGTYDVTVTDANNCPATASIGVNEPSLLVADLDSTNISCNGAADGTITLTPSGGTAPYSYSWSPVGNGTTLVNLDAGTYNVTLTDANGCTANNAANIIDPDPLELTISGDEEVCLGESASLSSDLQGGQGPYAYQWYSIPNSVNDTQTAISHPPAANTTYGLIVIDGGGCRVEDRYDVLVRPVPNIDFTPSLREGCDTLIVDFTNNTTDADQYSWNFGDNGTSNSFEPTHTYTTGLFTVELVATNQWGCTAREREFQLIQVLPTPIASFITDPDIEAEPICLSEASINFTSTTQFSDTVVWDFGNGDGFIGAETNYTYNEVGDFPITLVASNRFNCTDQVSSMIRILPDPFLYVPDAFTPNDDQVNDVFQAVGTEVTDFQILIFDRYGKLIFESNDLEVGWNGDIGGQPVPEGVYTYRIDARNNKGDAIRRAGNVTLYR